MKKLKWFGIILLLLAVCSVTCAKVMSEDLPATTKGAQAESLAQDMLNALNKDAWDDTRYLKWTFFGGGHHYHWDKDENIAIIEWKKNKVVMDLDQVDGLAMSNGEIVDGDKKKKLIDKAWGFWCNDSFWFCAPYKIMDKGVERSMVEEDSKKGLMVSYKSGGVTPGDSYLWWLDENNMPESWQMWTSVLPIKGIKNSWTGWTTLSTGAKISTAHGAFMNIEAKLSNVAGGNDLSSIGLSQGAFDLK